MTMDRSFNLPTLVQLLRRVDAGEAEKALRRIGEKRGLHDPYTKDEALWMLDELAKEAGLLGVVARFARARLFLS